MSQVLGDEFLLLAAAVNFRLEAIKGNSERGLSGWPGRQDLGEFWAEEPRLGAREEERNAQADWGDLVAMTVRDALDEAMQAQTAQVIGHPAHGVMGWVEAQQLSQQGSHFLISETPQLETEQHQHTQ